MPPFAKRLVSLLPRFLLSLILIIYMANIAWPYLYRESDQDACSFGPVTNEQYRAYLADVKQRAKDYWPPLPDGSHPWPVDDVMHKSLAYRLNDAVEGLDGFYHRLAMSHAVLRAVGMRVREKQSDANNRATLDDAGNANSLRYVYAFTSPNYTLIPMRMFRFDGKGTLSFIGGQETGQSLKKAVTAKTDDGRIAFTFEEMGFLKSDPTDRSDLTFLPRLVDYDKTYRPCPKMPDEAWVAAYEATRSVANEAAPINVPQAPSE
ncbi:hypothetical protein FDK21_12820 [Cohaesibacter sp. CAU 1516]|uniref:hypothetical protein n=1 Tax=Cohaesibacter sp. CAU 1516 TaxID=2576038 RepID=UPI0010FE4131|nr:hypothetical protein [Cohaesibacter sp. CAU 1516]TLP45621.1 hypothetical protein FDK21_12820 [Cohaesibacter sp. CAU 1516]